MKEKTIGPLVVSSASLILAAFNAMSLLAVLAMTMKTHFDHREMHIDKSGDTYYIIVAN